jgi:uncharacterized protein
MTEQKTKEFAAIVIREAFAGHALKLIKLILFGSRAQGNVKPDSDWDFIAVSDRPISRKEKKEIWLAINKTLSHNKIDADVLIKNEYEFDQDKNDTGKKTYYANKYGVIL